eukprot:6195764-Pleurochrysis_carterae.AAC.1
MPTSAAAQPRQAHGKAQLAANKERVEIKQGFWCELTQQAVDAADASLSSSRASGCSRRRLTSSCR